jgi:phosphatidyl-myo-inositol alpha-mannosyltransferase
MKVALVSPYDFAYPGGVVNHIVNLHRQLSLMGHDVKIVAPASARIPNLGDSFIPIGTPRAIPASGSICRVTVSFWLGSRVKEVLQREQFDIVHLHEPFMPMLCTTVLRLSDSINVGTFHAHAGAPGYNVLGFFGKCLIRRWNKKLHGRIAVSTPAHDFVNHYLPEEYNILPNGVDLTQFNPNVPAFPEYRDGKLNILFVGRMEKRKGLNYLIRAYEKIKPEFPDIRLLVVGPPTRLFGQYKRYIARKKLEDIVFIGRARQDDLPRYYQTADIFCTPATSCESFGIILLEAMAMSKPIVASENEGYRRVLDHGVQGLLTPPRKVDPLADALAELIKDEEKRHDMGVAGLVKAQQYSWKKVSRDIAALYTKLYDEYKR